MSRTRRTFLGAAAAAAISGAAGCGGARGTTWRVFSGHEARTLDALLEWIIPEDDSPGARGAGVSHYIDRQLSTHFREHRQAYRDGLAATDRLAGGDFAGAPRKQQQAALRKLQRDPATRPFFNLLVPHAMQGFYGNPRHGGNRDFASWRMLGVPPLPVRGRSQYDLTAGGGNAKS